MVFFGMQLASGMAEQRAADGHAFHCFCHVEDQEKCPGNKYTPSFGAMP